MQNIIKGFLKFQQECFPQRTKLFKDLANNQSPSVLFITCSDSRVVPEFLTQQEPGNLFVIRNAGNLVPSYGPEVGGVSASVEYAVAALGVTDIVICGHSDCGAMTAINQGVSLDHMPMVSQWLKHADAAKLVNATRFYASEAESLNGMVQANVVAQLSNLKTHPSVAVAIEQERLNLHGWVYDIESGEMLTLEGESKQFVSLSENPYACAFASHRAANAA